MIKWSRIAQSAVLLTGALAVGGQVREELFWPTVVVYLGTATVFLTWFRLTFLAAQAASPADLEALEPRWAVFAWLIPILNFVFPFVMTRRMWRALARAPQRELQPGPYFGFWWTTWVVSQLLQRLAPGISTLALVLAAFFAAVTIGRLTELATLNGRAA